ncbi:YciI family protein [Agrococcus jejuensis]|uniref:YciI family protein n=1 Tax=Agrococcus jejuensis TaxID=399736 RepID=UPI0011A1FA01|nr:YciI family protein [Agrococcus jejuensis]
MTTYAYFIHEGDWDSDAYMPADGQTADGLSEDFGDFAAFEERVRELGGTIVGGQALQNARYGGRVTPGDGERREQDAVYTDGANPELTEIVTGFYLIDVDDEAVARRIAAHVPTGGHVEWRRVFPMG